MTEPAVLEILRVIQTDIAGLKTDVAGMQTDIAGLKTDFASMQTDMRGLRAETNAIKAKIDAWPDVHFLQAAAQKQIAEAREAREHRRYIEIKLNEIYGSMATSAEIGKLREEVAQSLDRENELDLRISAIEIRLGIKNPLAPE